MTFWDWTLDWQDLRKAPIWGVGDLAFGTNGKFSPDTGDGVLAGDCVVDGAFAGMTVLYLNDTRVRHCLSRNFADPPELHSFGDQLQPKAIEALLSEPEFDVFSFMFEQATHLAVPNVILGDFITFTAPNGRFIPRSLISF